MKDILIYHGLGTGKTVTAINIIKLDRQIYNSKHKDSGDLSFVTYLNEDFEGFTSNFFTIARDLLGFFIEEIVFNSSVVATAWTSELFLEK